MDSEPGSMCELSRRLCATTVLICTKYLDRSGYYGYANSGPEEIRTAA
jgi:hypothetical protein